jgi:hypothetical protein
VSEQERRALERIARLGLEEGDYDYEPMVGALPIALEALGWVHWRCSSRFTACRASAVGPRAELETAGWKLRDGMERCPEHADTTDPTRWPAGTLS